MRVTKKISTLAAENFFFDQFNWIFYIKFTLNELPLLINKESCLLLLEEKKRQLVQINWLVENRLNSEFCWPNVWHYGIKIQCLTWT